MLTKIVTTGNIVYKQIHKILRKMNKQINKNKKQPNHDVESKISQSMEGRQLTSNVAIWHSSVEDIKSSSLASVKDKQVCQLNLKK